jgi:hypothetical protein
MKIGFGLPTDAGTPLRPEPADQSGLGLDPRVARCRHNHAGQTSGSRTDLVGIPSPRSVVMARGEMAYGKWPRGRNRRRPRTRSTSRSWNGPPQSTWRRRPGGVPYAACLLPDIGQSCRRRQRAQRLSPRSGLACVSPGLRWRCRLLQAAGEEAHNIVMRSHYRGESGYGRLQRAGTDGEPAAGTSSLARHRYRCTGRQSGEAWQYLPGRARPVAPVLGVRPPSGASQGSHLHRGGPLRNGMPARPGRAC